MSGSGFDYCVFTQGDRAIFDPSVEVRCPSAKVRMPDSRTLGEIIKRARKDYLDNYVPFDDVAHSEAGAISRILCATIAGQRICSFHLARSVGAATLEAATGFSGDDYEKLRRLLVYVVNVVSVGAPGRYEVEAQLVLGTLLNASAADGSRGFAEALKKAQRSGWG